MSRQKWRLSLYFNGLRLLPTFIEITKITLFSKKCCQNVATTKTSEQQKAPPPAIAERGATPYGFNSRQARREALSSAAAKSVAMIFYLPEPPSMRRIRAGNQNLLNMSCSFLLFHVDSSSTAPRCAVWSSHAIRRMVDASRKTDRAMDAGFAPARL